MARKHGVQIEVKPCDLGKVFGVSGGLPLAKRAPQRQAYRLVELARWSEYLGIPLKPQPAFFPVSPDLANKMIMAARRARHGSGARAGRRHHARPVGRG
jgi:2-hydroxychromene-2-carboxylate isomerase